MNTECKIVVKATGDACGKPVQEEVTFRDNTKTRTCTPCAIYLEQTAIGHGTNIRRERLK